MDGRHRDYVADDDGLAGVMVLIWKPAVDVSRCDTRDHQRSSAAAAAVVVAGPFDEVSWRISMRFIARSASTIRPASAPFSSAAAAVASISGEKSLIEARLAAPSIFGAEPPSRRRSVPRRLDRPSFSRPWTDEISAIIGGIAIERHRCRIYEMSYVFDRSASGCWGGKNAFLLFDVSTSLIIKLLPDFRRAFLIIQ